MGFRSNTPKSFPTSPQATAPQLFFRVLARQEVPKATLAPFSGRMLVQMGPLGWQGPARSTKWESWGGVLVS